ncbi:MAG: ABC transporter substrate-binding protein [Sulfurimonadaceae bacterium]|nr:ABC transporter substrate-binding protein [Sulfurimonadaceae bacterium]
MMRDRVPVRSILTLLFTSLLIMGGCSKYEETSRETIRIGTNYWLGYEPLYLAKGLGVMDRSRIRLVEYGSNTEVIEAYRNGVIEGAALTLDEALLMAEEQVPLKLLMVLDYSKGADSVIAREGIESVADLKNKRLGVETNALGTYMLSRMLEKGKLSAGDVKVTHVEFEQHEEVFDAKTVDAVITFEPVRSRLLLKGAREIFTSAEIPGEIIDVLVVRPELFDNFPETLRHLINGWYGALEYLKMDPDAAYRHMEMRQQLGQKEMAGALQTLEFPERVENCRLFSDGAVEINERIENLQKVMREYNLLERMVLTGEISDAPVERLLCSD